MLKDYIINFFILSDHNSLLNIYEYIKRRYYKTIDINNIKNEIAYLLKNKIIFIVNHNIYGLTKEGEVILNDHKYYYASIIIRFFKKYCIKSHKKYDLREIRLEQQMLRNYLITNKEHKCIICNKYLPLCLLETAHLKPRCLLNDIELKDNNIVEFMCRYCHNLYDNGLLGIFDGLLCVSSLIEKYEDLHYINKSQIISSNKKNKIYFNFHYKTIYKRGSSPLENLTHTRSFTSVAKTP